MPTPTQAATIRLLATKVAERAADVAARIHLGTKVGQTVAEFDAGVKALQAVEATAQLELCAAAEAAGVPLADATAKYGLAAATETGAGSTGGGIIVRTLGAIGRAIGFQGAGTAAVAGAVAVVATTAVVGGSIYMASNWGKPSVEPVKDGPAMSGIHDGSTVATTPIAHIGQFDQYFIYAVNTSGWSFFIGRPSDVENRAANTFQDGGTGKTPIEYKKLVDKPFDNSTAAKDYLKERVTPGKQSVWTGKWLKFEGGEYPTLHVGL